MVKIITSIRAKFIHSLRIQKCPSEFRNFVTMVDFHDENYRPSSFSPFNYHLVKGKTNPRYHISNSWKNLPFLAVKTLSQTALYLPMSVCPCVSLTQKAKSDPVNLWPLMIKGITPPPQSPVISTKTVVQGGNGGASSMVESFDQASSSYGLWK